jgi:hypothetical protein
LSCLSNEDCDPDADHGINIMEPWRKYEDAVRSIIAQHRDLLGLDSVELSPVKLEGKSGNTWNIEIIGYTAGQRKLVLVEVRRKTTRNIEPEEVGGFAYRIEDTGAEKGYMVTPLDRGLSIGAAKIAGYEEIGHINVSVEATPEDYIIQHMNSMFARSTEDVSSAIDNVKDEFRFLIKDKSGNLVQVTAEELHQMSKKPASDSKT